MLVLSRKEAEAITIRCPDGTVIEVSVVEISRWNVRLGFKAPAAVNVVRKERDDGRALRLETPPPFGGGAEGIKGGAAHGEVVPGRVGGQGGLHIWPESNEGRLSD
jgi:carbon storage regulator CsrA